MIDSDYFEHVPGDETGTVGVFTNSWAGGPKKTCSGGDCPVPIWNQVQWWVGKPLPNGSFVPNTTGAMDYGQYEPSSSSPLGYDIASNGGAQYYTPKSGAGQGGTGRRVVFSWLEDGLTGAAAGTANASSNCRALPRDWRLDPASHTILQQPVPELASLRLGGPGDHVRMARVRVAGGGSPTWLEGVAGPQLEVRARISTQAGDGVEAIALLVWGPGGETATGATVVGVNLTSGLVFTERQLGGHATGTTDTRAGPIPQPHNGTLDVHLFVDGSVTEAFWNGRTTVSAWTYPSSAAMDRVGVTARCRLGVPSCQAEVQELEVWRLSQIY
jgi:sucrose-6-phosphate hydrolase SacC (GH32 family)